MKKYGLLFFTFFVSAIFAPAHQNGIDPSVFAFIDAKLQSQVDAGNTPGVALFIGRCPEQGPDEVLYEKVYGWRENTTTNPDEREDLTIDTLFDLASVTKPTFTASAVMFLIQDGILSEEDFAYSYIPGFEQNGKDDIRIRHLLTHSSGLPAYTGVPGSPPGPNPDALIQKICGLSEVYSTGEDYTYSCLNYIILARIVENVTGESVTEFLKRRVWDEVGMIDSTHFPSTEQINRTSPTTLTRRGKVHDPLAYYYTDYTAKNHACGNAGGFSTVLDESRLIRILLRKGTLYGKQIYTPSIVEKITTRQTSVASRTYGWGISSYARAENQTPETCCLSHSGYTGTYIWFDKYSRAYIVIFTNYVYPNDNSSKKSAFRSARADMIWGVINHMDIYNNVPEEGFVADNDEGAPEYTETGSWTAVSHTGYMGKTYRYAAAGTPAFADYHLEMPFDGRYRIHCWYKSGDHTADTKYIVHHRGGSDTVSIDQRINGEMWVKLGEYAFDKGENILRLDAEHSSGGGGYVIADAVMAECLERDTDVIVDNRDPGYTDTEGFFSSSASPFRYREDYRACNPGEGENATWTLDLPEAGIWEIREWHNGNSTRSSSTPFTVTHAAGEKIFYVNEQERSGRWNLLGTFPFQKGGGRVRLESVSDKIVVADAVRARKVALEIIVDNLDARYRDTGGFFTSSSSPFRYDATYRACLTGSGENATWDLDLPHAGIWEIYEWHNGNETRTSRAPYTIDHSGGKTTVIVNQQEGSGQWNLLGRFTFEKNAGSVMLSNECTGGDYVIADAVRAVYVVPISRAKGKGFALY